ncbi:MAG: transposase [Chitinophagaceae bacterium]
MQIEGVSHVTILSIISETGPEGFQKFDTSKHFASWLRLAPNRIKCPALARVLSVSGDLHSLNDRYNVNESVADDFN